MRKPEFWILTGTTLPPMNVCWAIVFAIFARVRKWSTARELTRSLNVQITYTLILSIPFICGNAITHWHATQRLFPPGSEAALIAGLSLGLVGAVAILALVFFNTRAFTESLFGRPHIAIPHLRFFRE